jgi:hypothetical protein
MVRKTRWFVAMAFALSYGVPSVSAQNSGASPAGTSQPATSANSSGTATPGAAPSAAASAQGGTHLDGSTTAGPNIGANPAMQPAPFATPGTSRFEGAQPGQSGTNESLQSRSLVRKNPVDAAPQLDDNFGANQFQTVPRGTRPAAFPFGDNRNALNESGQITAPRGFSRRVSDRAFIINDLRTSGFPAEDWRVVFTSGRWWFYTPERTWLYYNDTGNWLNYEPAEQNNATVSRRSPVEFPAGFPAEEWRLVFHDGRWWFWTPNNTWLYQDQGRWVVLDKQYAVAALPPTEEYWAGYRGIEPQPQMVEPGRVSPNIGPSELDQPAGLPPQ